MFLLQAVLILFLLSTSSTCPCQTSSPRAYELGPSDVDFGAMGILGTSTNRLIMLRRPIGADNRQVYLGSTGRGWHRASRQQEIALNHLVIASGAGHGTTLYRLLGDHSNVEGSSILERSADKGRSWRRAKLQLLSPVLIAKNSPRQMRLRVLGVDGLTVFANIAVRRDGTREWENLPGVYVSRNGGDQWILFSTDLDPESIVTENGGLIFGVRDARMVKSNDDGRSWVPAEIGEHLPADLPLQGLENAPSNRRSAKLQIYQLEFLSSNVDSALFVTNGGLFIARDNGKQWCLVTFDTDLLYTVQSVAIAGPNGSHILVSTTGPSGPKLWESMDRGQTFHSSPIENFSESEPPMSGPVAGRT